MEKLYQLRIGALAGALTRERLSFWLLCFYVFLEYVRPQSIYPAIDVIPWAQTAILLTIVFFLLEGNRFSVKNPANSLMLAFLAVIVLSSALAYRPEVAFENIYIFFAWFIVYFLIINVVNTEAKFFVFLVLYMLWNVKMTQHGFFSWASRGFGYADWGVTGAPGWFHNSGEFGIQLSIFIPLSIYFIHALRRYWGTLKFLVLLAVPFTAFASVVATSSRGALLGAGAAIAWMALKSRNRVLVALVFVIPLAYGVYKALPSESMTRWEAAGTDETSLTRMTRWERGLDMMNSHPLLGVGYENWMPYYRDHYPPELVGGGTWGLAHNIFIDAGSQLGYLGLGLFVALIVTAFVTNHRTRQIATQAGNRFLFFMAHALDASMVGFIFSGSFVSVLFYPYFWIGLSFTVALHNVALVALQERTQGAPAAAPKTHPGARFPAGSRPPDVDAARAGAR